MKKPIRAKKPAKNTPHTKRQGISRARPKPTRSSTRPKSTHLQTIQNKGIKNQNPQTIASKQSKHKSPNVVKKSSDNAVSHPKSKPTRLPLKPRFSPKTKPPMPTAGHAKAPALGKHLGTFGGKPKKGWKYYMHLSPNGLYYGNHLIVAHKGFTHGMSPQRAHFMGAHGILFRDVGNSFKRAIEQMGGNESKTKVLSVSPYPGTSKPHVIHEGDLILKKAARNE